MTRQQRLKIYYKAISYYQDKSMLDRDKDGICIFLDDNTPGERCGDLCHKMGIIFPEFGLCTPLYLCNHWFPLDKEGNKLREIILQFCVAMVEYDIKHSK